MTYVDGFIAAVPEANMEAYRLRSEEAAKLFLQWGATRVVENWGDDVPSGEVTDFRRAVDARPGEVIVFSWIEYPDKQTRDRVNEKMASDYPPPEDGERLFDGRRMIFGGFTTLLSES